MCLAVPFKLKEINPDGVNAVAERDGISRMVNVSFIRGPKAGDYVIVHAGFAIERIREQQAADVMESYNELMQELQSISENAGSGN